MVDLTSLDSAFLDSSFICNVLSAIRGTSDTTSNFCLKFLEQLNKSNTKLGLSAISAIEVMSIGSTEGQFVPELLNALRSDTVQILPYDLEQGAAARKYGGKYINEKQLNSFILSFNENFPNYKILRDHISDDLKIASTCLTNGYEYLLTTDHRTMHPIAKEIGVQTILCHFDICFNHSGNNIFTYEPSDAEDEYKKRMGLN